MRKALLLQFVSPKLLNCLGKIVMLYKEFLKSKNFTWRYNFGYSAGSCKDPLSYLSKLCGNIF